MTPDKKLEAFEALLNEISGGLADVVEAMKDKSEAGAMEEISSTLVEMKEVIEAATKNKSYDGLVAAIKAIRIQSSAVTVNVNPTPITITPVVQIIERVQPGNYRLSVSYDRQDRIIEALISKVS